VSACLSIWASARLLGCDAVARRRSSLRGSLGVRVSPSVCLFVHLYGFLGGVPPRLSRGGVWSIRIELHLSVLSAVPSARPIGAPKPRAPAAPREFCWLAGWAGACVLPAFLSVRPSGSAPSSGVVSTTCPCPDASVRASDAPVRCDNAFVCLSVREYCDKFRSSTAAMAIYARSAQTAKLIADDCQSLMDADYRELDALRLKLQVQLDMGRQTARRQWGVDATAAAASAGEKKKQEKKKKLNNKKKGVDDQLRLWLRLRLLLWEIQKLLSNGACGGFMKGKKSVFQQCLRCPKIACSTVPAASWPTVPFFLDCELGFISFACAARAAQIVACIDQGQELLAHALELIRCRLEESAREAKELATADLLRELEEEEAAKKVRSRER
jgi:hypothetical protein